MKSAYYHDNQLQAVIVSHLYSRCSAGLSEPISCLKLSQGTRNKTSKFVTGVM